MYTTTFSTNLVASVKSLKKLVDGNSGQVCCLGVFDDFQSESRGNNGGMIGPALASVPIDISDLERVDPAVASGLNLDADMFRRAFLHVGVATSFDPVDRISKPKKP